MQQQFFDTVQGTSSRKYLRPPCAVARRPTCRPDFWRSNLLDACRTFYSPYWKTFSHTLGRPIVMRTPAGAHTASRAPAQRECHLERRGRKAAGRHSCMVETTHRYQSDARSTKPHGRSLPRTRDRARSRGDWGTFLSVVLWGYLRGQTPPAQTRAWNGPRDPGTRPE